MRTALLGIIGLALVSATLGAGQAEPAAVLPRELRAHVRSEQFQIVSSIRGLPAGVRSEMQTLFGSQTLDIAEPDGAVQDAGGTADSRLPTRRLAAAGCSYEDCLVYYERGRGSARTWRVVLFHWTPDLTRLEWGGTAPGGLATLDDVRRAVLSGAVKGAAGPW